MSDEDKPYILMHNYGTEGWNTYKRYDTAQEALTAALDETANFGQEWMIVEKIPVVIVEGETQIQKVSKALVTMYEQTHGAGWTISDEVCDAVDIAKRYVRDD